MSSFSTTRTTFVSALATLVITGLLTVTTLAVTENQTVFGDIYSAGLKWTARTSSTDNEWRSITYGNGLFVASSKTGSGDQIMTSPDGINWTTQSTPTAREWRYVTYGNGMFVAVAATGTGNRIMTSPDGVNWTLRTSPADYLWRAVAWGGGQFVATANNGTGNQVMTSPDGINWTAHDSSVVCDFFGLEYGKGLFIASGTDCLMTSPDGVTWTTRTVPSGSSHQWHAIKYGDGLFVSVSKTGTERAMYSYDGITWTAASTPNTNAYHDVTFGNGMFVAAANSGTGNRIMTSGNMRSYDVTNDGVTRRAVTISATGTETLAVQGGYGNNFLTADTSNLLLRIIGSQTPTSNLFEVSNRDNSRKYLTVSSTSTKISNAFHVEVLETTNTSITVAATNTVIILRGVVARTVTLPACAAADVGRKLFIDDGAQNANTNNITVNRAGSDTVDGGTSKTINTAGGSLQLVCAAATRWFSL